MASSVLTKTVALRHSLSLPSSSFLSKPSWMQTLSFTSKTFSKPSTALSSSLRSLTIVPELCRLPAGRVRCFATRQASSSLNDPSPNWSNRPPKETILLDGCDFEHWLVVMEPPEGQPTRDDIIDSYIKTLAQIVGSEDEARMKIYSVSTRHYFAFGALVSEELSYKIKALPKVRWVLPDSYLDVKNKDYGGEPFVNGQAVPYDPKYHEEWVRNNQKAQERSRRNDRPRNSDRSRNFDRRRENMQNRDFQRSDMPPPPMPNVPPSNTPPPPPSYQNFNPQNNMPPPPSHQNAPPRYQNPPPGNMPPPSYQNAPPSYQNPGQGNMPPPSYQNPAQGNMPPPNYQNPGQGNMPPPSYQNVPPSYQNPAQGHMPPPGYRNPSPYNNMPPSNYQNPSAQNFQNPNAPPPNFRNPMPPPSYHQNPNSPPNYEKPNMQNMPNRDYPGRDKPDNF